MGHGRWQKLRMQDLAKSRTNLVSGFGTGRGCRWIFNTQADDDDNDLLCDTQTSYIDLVENRIEKLVQGYGQQSLKDDPSLDMVIAGEIESLPMEVDVKGE